MKQLDLSEVKWRLTNVFHVVDYRPAVPIAIDPAKQSRRPSEAEMLAKRQYLDEWRDRMRED